MSQTVVLHGKTYNVVDLGLKEKWQDFKLNSRILFNNKYNPKIKVCSEDSDCTKCPRLLAKKCPGYRKPIIDKSKNAILFRPLMRKYISNGKGELEVKLNIEEMEKRYNCEMEEKGYITKSEVFEILKKDYLINLSSSILKDYSKYKLVRPIVIRLEGKGALSFYKKNTPSVIYLIRKLNKQHKIKMDIIKRLFSLLRFEDPGANKEIIEFSKREESIRDISSKVKPEKAAEIEALITYHNREKINAEIDLMYLKLVAPFMAVVELGWFKPKMLNLKLAYLITKAKVDINEKYILVDFREALLNKKVWFTKDGIEIE